MPSLKRLLRQLPHTLRSFIGTALLPTFLLLSACSQVQIKNSPWCGSLGIEGASCWDTLDNTSKQLNIQEWAARWDDLTDPLVCTNTSTLADWKADLEKLCSYDNVCTYQVKMAVEAFYAKVSAASATAAKQVKKP